MTAMRFRTPTYTVGSFNLCHNIFKDGTSIRCKNYMHMTPGKRSAKYKQKTRHINVYKISVLFFVLFFLILVYVYRLLRVFRAVLNSVSFRIATFNFDARARDVPNNSHAEVAITPVF